MERILDELLFAFLIFLPAGMANMSPVFANRMPVLRKWDAPLDMGRSFRGKRLLGANKRWRGLVFGTLVGMLTAIIEFVLITRFLVSPTSLFVIGLAGALMGFGALLGDAVESFFKRQAGVKPGHSWFPFDQIDYIIGGLLLSYPIIGWPLDLALTVFVLYFGLHLLASYIGYLIGLKEKPI